MSRSWVQQLRSCSTSQSLGPSCAKAQGSYQRSLCSRCSRCQYHIHNLQGPVKNENAGPLVQKPFQDDSSILNQAWGPTKCPWSQPGTKHSTRPKWSQSEVQQGWGWGRGLLGRHSAKSVFTTYWILPSVTDMPFQRHPCWLCLATTNYAWVDYELKHYHYFQILWGSSERFEIHSHNLKKCQQWNCQWKKRKNCYILSVSP